MSVSRRDFLAAGATAAAGVALGTPLAAQPTPTYGALSGLAAERNAFARPVVIASDNGIRGVKKAYDMIVSGADTIDAIMAGVNITELDPEDMSVGLGGLPNEEGVVQLDAELHARPQQARRGGRLSGRHRDPIARGEGRDGLHRPHHARGRGREAVRAQDGVQGAGSAHREESRRMDQVEDAGERERWLAGIAGAAAARTGGRAAARPAEPPTASRSSSTTRTASHIRGAPST